MKFAEKYEILEMVTSGRVSTFLARERTTQDAVVVYTFECAGTGANDLSTASIISRFCSLAPNPPGMIVKAGFDEPSSSAFITTKMPDSGALQAWVQAYHSFVPPAFAPPGSSQSSSVPLGAARPVGRQTGGPVSDETVELSAFEVKSVLAKSGPPPQQGPVESPVEDVSGGTAAFSLSGPTPAAPHPGGEFTRLFREVNAFQPAQSAQVPAPPKPSNATDAMFGEPLGGSPLGREKAAQSATPTPVEASPGSFTREFLGISSEKAEPVQRRGPVPPTPQKEPGAFTREFMAVSQESLKTTDQPSGPVSPAQNSPSPATSFESIFGPASSQPASSVGGAGGQAEDQKGGAGEFTSFFRDPFEHPGAPEKSRELPDVGSSAPPKKQMGDFTRVFGKGDLEQGAPDPLPPQEEQPAPGSFTQIFREISSDPGKGSQLGASTLGTDPNIRPSFFDPAPVTPAPPEPLRGGMSSTPVPPPLDPFFPRTPPAVPPASNQNFMNRAGSSEATDVFRIPGAEAPPIEVGPSGPSEFTVFLSRSQINASLPPEPAVSGGPGGGAPPPAFAAPPVPPPPPFQFAPPPPLPAPPAMKFPPAPAPPAVPRPAIPAMPPKSASIWPLITVLTVLLAIGVLLVMYFALKH